MSYYVRTKGPEKGDSPEKYDEMDA